MSRESVMQSASEGGIAASHPPLESSAVLAGPATAKEFNRIRGGIIPLACWRVENLRFEFDSSFVKPEIAKEIQQLWTLREGHKRIDPYTQQISYPPLSIFGHTDPVGEDEYNKHLSGRRAAAIYGLLTRTTTLWEELYTQPYGGDNWGTPVLQTMQVTTGLPSSTPRQALFHAYMDHLCTVHDDQGVPVLFKLQATDFLGQGTDPDGKGDYQGCGEFNPVLLFSKQEEQRYAQPEQKAKRDEENKSNRRVMVLLFQPGSQVLPEKWPCPRAKEGIAGCKKRFWSDGERRRNTHLPEERREYQKTQDTFACRFYDRLTNSSPCERILKIYQIRLYDPSGRAIGEAPYEITIGNRKNRKPISDKADRDGYVTLHDIEVPTTSFIKWGYKPEPGEAPMLIFSLNLYLNIDEQSEEEEARKKLNNLGYVNSDLAVNREAFQRDYGHLAKPGETQMELLRRVYQSCADDLGKTTNTVK